MRKTCPAHTLYRAANNCAPCRDQAAKYERWRQLGRLRGESLRVPGVGTSRRLRALAVMGWGSHPIAARLGVDPVLVERWRSGKPEVHRDTARRVDAVFRELCMTPGPSKVAADRARAKGWLPPLAWECIDTDPEPATVTALPDVVDEVAVERACAGHHVDLTPAERVEVVRRLAARGVSDNAIAEVVQVRPESVQRLRARHGIRSTYQEMRTA